MVNISPLSWKHQVSFHDFSHLRIYFPIQNWPSLFGTMGHLRCPESPLDRQNLLDKHLDLKNILCLLYDDGGNHITTSYIILGKTQLWPSEVFKKKIGLVASKFSYTLTLFQPEGWGRCCTPSQRLHQKFPSVYISEYCIYFVRNCVLSLDKKFK